MSGGLSTGYQRVATGEVDHYWQTSRLRPGKVGVVYCHGALTTQAASGNYQQLSTAKMIAAIASAGIPVVAPCEGLDYWGNDTAAARINSSIALLNSMSGSSATKCIGLGISMGGAWIARWAELNPTKVAAIVGIIPAVNIIRMQQTPNSQFPQQIAAAAAWNLAYRSVTDGVTTATSTTVSSATAAFVAGDVGKLCIGIGIPPGATIVSQTGTAAVLSAAATATGSALKFEITAKLPTGSPNADIMSMASTLATNSIPNRLYYSTVDQYITPADVTTFAASSGGTAIPIDTTYGHADGTIGEVGSYNGGTDYSDLIAYLRANGA